MNDYDWTCFAKENILGKDLYEKMRQNHWYVLINIQHVIRLKPFNKETFYDLFIQMKYNLHSIFRFFNSSICSLLFEAIYCFGNTHVENIQ